MSNEKFANANAAASAVDAFAPSSSDATDEKEISIYRKYVERPTCLVEAAKLCSLFAGNFIGGILPLQRIVAEYAVNPILEIPRKIIELLQETSCGLAASYIYEIRFNQKDGVDAVQIFLDHNKEVLDMFRSNGLGISVEKSCSRFESYEVAGRFRTRTVKLDVVTLSCDREKTVLNEQLQEIWYCSLEPFSTWALDIRERMSFRAQLEAEAKEREAAGKSGGIGK